MKCKVSLKQERSSCAATAWSITTHAANNKKSPVDSHLSEHRESQRCSSALTVTSLQSLVFINHHGPLYCSSAYLRTVQTDLRAVRRSESDHINTSYLHVSWLTTQEDEVSLVGQDSSARAKESVHSNY